MDALKAQLDRIMKQLGGLTASQRMLVGTLVAVMVLTLLYWGKYAGNPEMVPVLGQTMSDDEIGRIDMALEAKGIPHTVSAGKVLVPADRKMEIVADLMFSHALPRDTQSAFDDMMGKLNEFGSDSERQAYENQAKQMELAQIIRRFPGVDDARVIINAKMDRRIEGSIPPSATVWISTREAGASKELVTAAAEGVAGAVAGLTPSHISVIINGTSRRVPDSANDPMGTSSDLLDQRKQSEAMFEQKIRDRFQYIEGLTVTVACDIENRSISERAVKYDDKATLTKEVETHEHTEETSVPSASSAEAGVGANTAASIGGGSAAPSNSTTSITDNTTKNTILPAESVTNISTPAGKDTVQSVTVGVPRSYFATIYKIQNGKDADDATLQAFSAAQIAVIKTAVKNCVALKSDDNLSVDMYSDAQPMLAMASGPALVASGTPGISSVTGHAKEIALGVLAVISLFMMSSMVKKATPAPLIATAAPTTDQPTLLTAGEMLAGEAGDSSTTLDGMELDSETVRAQQMLDQVSTMVKENPDGAAAMVKRWLNRT